MSYFFVSFLRKKVDICYDSEESEYNYTNNLF